MANDPKETSLRQSIPPLISTKSKEKMVMGVVNCWKVQCDKFKYGWLSSGEERIRQLGLAMKLRGKERLMYDSTTSPLFVMRADSVERVLGKEMVDVCSGRDEIVVSVKERAEIKETEKAINKENLGSPEK
jgi:hypothetical protein